MCSAKARAIDSGDPDVFGDCSNLGVDCCLVFGDVLLLDLKVLNGGEQLLRVSLARLRN